MSRFSQYNKNDTYRENMNYANLQKERRTNEELQEVERDRIAMERLKIQIEQEKKLEKERKNQIRQQQYEDYSNYMKQKYAQTPQNRENLNIKLGGEKRFIRKPSYNQQMENLCLNPTRQANVYPMEPVKNFSEAGRNYQRGYSHGYNILTGETFSPQEQAKQKTPRNVNINLGNENNGQQERAQKTEYPKEKEIQNLNKENEDFNQYKAYMEMKKQKEQEEMYYLQQQSEKENQSQNMGTQPQFQPKLSPQNFNEYNQRQNPPEIGMNLNEIPQEYREMYMNQQIQQQKEQEFQRQQQEIPPEYKEMYLNKQLKEQENQKEELSPNQFNEKNKNRLIPQKKEEIPDEYSYSQNNNKENNVHEEKMTEKDYKEYLLSQQKEKEREDENNEIYQNMLREKERENLEKNEQREQYQQYLVNNQNQNMNQIKREQSQQYPYQYQEKQKINENQVPKREDLNELNNKPIDSFEEYYKMKDNNNIPEQQNKYENYQPQYPQEMPKYYPPQEQGLDEKEFLMYQQQKQMQEMEERERARQILERQQMEKMNSNQNEYYPEEYSRMPYNSPYNNQLSEQMSEFNTAKMEYLHNKQKNMLSKENIFSESKIQTPQPKYTNEPLTKSDKLRIQREYAQFLDAQINAKNIKNMKNKNNGLGQNQSSGYELEGPNPYQQLRDRHNKLKDIPQDPYSVKNYNISNNSYLTSNPITNPVNSYKFVDRRRDSSGTLQNNGNNIVGK